MPAHWAGGPLSAAELPPRSITGAIALIPIKRTASVSAVIDATTKTKSIRVGSISNTAPLTVGAKSPSEDFYAGLMDELSFAR
jgi:hypothetical protein